MCGIAGYTDFTYGEPLAQVLAVMARALARRGPDGQGTLIEGPCGFAHTRLSIIDLAGSPQPMRVEGSDISLVYNGELYNYQELRGELQSAGERFSTGGDTEVILRAVGREWARALPKFDGMFAIAAWDRRNERLLLARDPLGEKPLFYATPTPGVLVFGSELKAVLAHPSVKDELDLDALRQVLRFRAVYGTRSLSRGIRQVEPGTYLEFTRDGVRTGRFFNLADATDRLRQDLRGKADADLVEEGRRLFVDSVRQRLVADVPVGAFLSGGLDSSLIVAAMRQIQGPGADIRTFSVGFANDPYSELPAARIVADAVRSNHTEVNVGEADYAARLSELTACRDAPISEPSDVAIAEMSRVARQSVKVVLSGEGSDEVFGGYPKYSFADTSGGLRIAVRMLGPGGAARLAGFVGLDRRRAKVAARALAQPGELSRLVHWFSYLDRVDLRALLPGLAWDDGAWDACTEAQRGAFGQVPAWSRLSRMQFVDCLTWLPGNLLERGDRMTMAEGLEARPPFLDRELVAFGLAIPDHLRVRGWTGKWIVRQWAHNLLPANILRRRKWGFRVPLAEWFRGRLRSTLHDYLGSRSGLCGQFGSVREVQALLEAHDTRKVDANLTLWTLLGAEIWFQDVFLARHRSSTDGETPVRVASPAGSTTAIAEPAQSAGHESDPPSLARNRPRPLISVVIPAHDEEAVIARCLNQLTGDADLEIVVVCNGCTDRTSEIARGFGGLVTVIETDVPSKARALNLGDGAAHCFPRFYVDADVVISADAIKAMARRLTEGGYLAVAPRFRMNLNGASWAVRAFYAINDRMPSAREGLGGSGVYGLSREGRGRFEQFPDLTADDGFVRLQFRPDERVTVSEHRSTVSAPRTLADLTRIKTRSHYGTAELRRAMPHLWANRGPANRAALPALMLQPSCWPHLPIYALVKLTARWRAFRQRRDPSKRTWERDETSRLPAPRIAPRTTISPGITRDAATVPNGSTPPGR